MAVQITCINKDNGNHQNPHEGITHVGWWNHSNGATGRSTRADMVKYIEDNGEESVYVHHGGKTAYVAVVTPEWPRQKFLRTYADGYYRDNLLDLDEC